MAVGAWLYFCAAYTGRSPRRTPYRRAIITVFLLFTSLKFANPIHNFYFTTEWTTVPFSHLAIQPQLLYWVVLGVSYAIIAVGFFMLIEQLYYTGTDSRPLVILAGLTAVPAIATILSNQISSLLPLMYEPLGVALFAVGTLFVYQRRFEAIRLTNDAGSPAIFLGQDGCIRDYNPAALELFPSLRGSIGKSPDSVNVPLGVDFSETKVITVTQEEETHLYEVLSSPFTSGNVQTGQLVTILDVTDRELYRQQLENSTEQLAALNRVIRHDIRNDMAVIIGWAEMLDDHVDEDGEDILDRVLRKSHNVVNLTDIARDFVETLSDGNTVELKSVDLADTLEVELAAIQDSYADAVFNVSVEIPSTAVQGNAMLSSVFRNLFGNAVRHNNKETPEITVTLEEHPETVIVRVADNGLGVPDEQKEEIFGKGKKGIESEGTGIGLYLVHTLVEQFGGSVWVEDNDPTGAVFAVELQKAE